MPRYKFYPIRKGGKRAPGRDLICADDASAAVLAPGALRRAKRASPAAPARPFVVVDGRDIRPGSVVSSANASPVASVIGRHS